MKHMKVTRPWVGSTSTYSERDPCRFATTATTPRGKIRDKNTRIVLVSDLFQKVYGMHHQRMA